MSIKIKPNNDFCIRDINTNLRIEGAYFCDHGDTKKEGYYTSELHVNGQSHWIHYPKPADMNDALKGRYAFDMAEFAKLGVRVVV